MAKISKVIIPVVPVRECYLQQSIPKKCPNSGKPLIQYIVEEIKQAGFNEIILINIPANLP